MIRGTHAMFYSSRSCHPSRWIAILALALPLCLGSGCRPADSKPELDDAQSRDVVRQTVLSQPALFQRIEYNPTDGEAIGKIIDAAVQRNVENRNFGKWPATRSEAESFGEMIAGNVWRDALNDPSGREAVEAKMIEYWKNPKVATMPGGEAVEMDLGVAPGKIELDSKNTFTVRSSEFVEEMQLKPAELAARLKALQTAHPNVKRHRVKVVATPHLRDHSELIYEYEPESDLLTVYKPPEVYRSPEPVGGLSRLESGAAPSHTNKLKILPGGRVGPPRR